MWIWVPFVSVFVCLKMVCVLGRCGEECKSVGNIWKCAADEGAERPQYDVLDNPLLLEVLAYPSNMITPSHTNKKITFLESTNF